MFIAFEKDFGDTEPLATSVGVSPFGGPGEGDGEGLLLIGRPWRLVVWRLVGWVLVIGWLEGWVVGVR